MNWSTLRNINGWAESYRFSRLTFFNAQPSAIRMRLWNWKQQRRRREFVPPDRNVLDTGRAFQLK